MMARLGIEPGAGVLPRLSMQRRCVDAKVVNIRKRAGTG